jgi:hypothetical protein
VCELIDVLREFWPEDVYAVVGHGGDVDIEIGAQSVTIPALAGWKVRVFRQSLVQYKNNPGTNNSYFEVATITGEITFSVALAEWEEIIIWPAKPA